MHKRILSILVVIALFAISAVHAESLDEIGDKVFEQKVLEVIMKHPEVIEKTMQLYVEKKRKDQEATNLNDALKNKVKVDYANSPTLGKKDAKYQLVIFTDFECPYCKRGDETVQQLKAKYKDDLFIVHKNYPLPFHKNAKPAALAALAAHQQGKFFDYSSKLFQNQNKLGEELYLQIAKDLKLDLDKFKKDKDSDKLAKLLEEDIKESQKVKIESTPNFILNGVRITGAYPLEHFEKVMKLVSQK